MKASGSLRRDLLVTDGVAWAGTAGVTFIYDQEEVLLPYELAE